MGCCSTASACEGGGQVGNSWRWRGSFVLLLGGTVLLLRGGTFFNGESTASAAPEFLLMEVPPFFLSGVIGTLRTRAPSLARSVDCRRFLAVAASAAGDSSSPWQWGLLTPLDHPCLHPPPPLLSPE